MFLYKNHIHRIIKISQNYGFYETREIWYSYGFDFNKFNIDKFKHLITYFTS